MQRRTPISGFTLLELILVMVIACTALALAAPSMTNWSRGSKLRNAAENILAMTHYARAEAIMNGMVYRVEVGQDGGVQLMKQQGTSFVTTTYPAMPAVVMPEGCRIDVTKTGTTNADSTDADAKMSLDFDAVGRCTPGTIKIADKTNASFSITANTPTEQFVLQGGTQ